LLHDQTCISESIGAHPWRAAIALLRHRTMENPLLDGQKFGQSIWYDNIRRGLFTAGELAGMVEKDGLLGVTSNPAIFEKAITGSTDYDQPITGLVARGVQTSKDVYERLAVQDVQLAADVFYPTYVRTGHRDGYL